jgi:hypothetical protein
MPIAWLSRGTEKLGPANFPAPKRADLRGWWNAVRKARPSWGLAQYQPEQFTVEVFPSSIILRRNSGSPYVLVINRKGGVM